VTLEYAKLFTASTFDHQSKPSSSHPTNLGPDSCLCVQFISAAICELQAISSVAAPWAAFEWTNATSPVSEPTAWTAWQRWDLKSNRDIHKRPPSNVESTRTIAGLPSPSPLYRPACQASSAVTMDIAQAASNYITKMVSSGDTLTSAASAKMKVMLLDKDTVSIVSTAMTQSSLLSHEVYLIDRLDNTAREKMRHLRCICLVRPSPDSIQLLVDELRDPKYGEYYLFFTNIVKKSSLERLAEADDNEAVKLVQEHFADYIVANSDLFSLGFTPAQDRIWDRSADRWNGDALLRCSDGILSVLLALKKKPLIRYQKNSTLAQKLASEVRYRITQEEQLFDFRKTDTPPLLLVLDRREDPVTPLLTQWTYQAMVHHLLGIRNGRVDLGNVPDIRPELKEIVLSQEQDPFFKKNMFLNFGELGGNIKEYVEQYQSKTKNNANIESINDMKRFIEEYPEFRKLSGNVSKHVALVSELSRRVGAENLLEVSELEQSLACNDNHSRDVAVRNASKDIPSQPLLLTPVWHTEHSNSYTIPDGYSGQQGLSCSTICAEIRQTHVIRPSHAHGPACRRWRRVSKKSAACVKSSPVPRLPSTDAVTGRRHLGHI